MIRQRRRLTYLSLLLLTLHIHATFSFATAAGAAQNISKAGGSHSQSSSSSTHEHQQQPACKEASSASAAGETSTSLNAMSGRGRSASEIGRLEELKKQEAKLARQLAALRREKLSALRSRPLTIGVVGFGRFGQFIARTFAKHGRVVVTSRSDYTDIANGMGVTYVPLSDPEAFLDEGLDVIVLAVSILSFDSTVQKLAPQIQKYLDKKADQGGLLRGPLVVDVLSVKEHPRQILLDMLPSECDILCTHPMFGPDSGKNGWHGLTFVYERTRIDNVLLDPSHETSFHHFTDMGDSDSEADGSFVELGSGAVHDVHENSEAHVEGMDRMERFLSIWEEEGCRMVPLSCADHDEYAANSQFITHLMGRILGSQGLSKTPIDTKGFESVLKLIGNTMADSFDLFYGLYKYNKNSAETIRQLQGALSDVVVQLEEMEKQEQESK